MTPEQEANVKECIKGFLHYYAKTGLHIPGTPFTYGSDKLHSTEDGRRAVHALVGKEYMRVYGSPIPASSEYVALQLVTWRKRGYESFRDGTPCVVVQTLFDEEDPDCRGVVYAYVGVVARVDGAVIKIGFTGQPIGRYLNGRQIAHNPELLATIPGGRTEEQAEHAKWRHFRADGREWFWPRRPLLEHLRRSWDYRSDFDEIVKRRIDPEWRWNGV